jgi:hypothetical protein
MQYQDRENQASPAVSSCSEITKQPDETASAEKKSVTRFRGTCLNTAVFRKDLLIGRNCEWKGRAKINIGGREAGVGEMEQVENENLLDVVCLTNSCLLQWQLP